jgi:acyl-CoA thioester hydrolase
MDEPIDPVAARSVVRLRVRFCETDLMGIVHHGSYVTYLEVGRVEWLRRRGVTYASWAQRGLHLAVVELSLRYRAPARFDDEIDVETTLAERRAATVRFDYRLLRTGDGALLAEGSTRLACVDDEGALKRLQGEMVEVLVRGDSSLAGQEAPEEGAVGGMLAGRG